MGQKQTNEEPRKVKVLLTLQNKEVVEIECYMYDSDWVDYYGSNESENKNGIKMDS